MEIQEVIEFVDGLTIGFSKETGERLFNTDENPKVIESLKESLEILKKEQKRIERKNNRPARAKEKWTDEEEKELVEVYKKYEDDVEFPRLVEKLAKKHQRTEGSIRSRINKLV